MAPVRGNANSVQVKDFYVLIAASHVATDGLVRNYLQRLSAGNKSCHAGKELILWRELTAGIIMKEVVILS